jgi:hypothetical protein
MLQGAVFTLAATLLSPMTAMKKDNRSKYNFMIQISIILRPKADPKSLVLLVASLKTIGKFIWKIIRSIRNDTTIKTVKRPPLSCRRKTLKASPLSSRGVRSTPGMLTCEEVSTPTGSPTPKCRLSLPQWATPSGSIPCHLFHPGVLAALVPPATERRRLQRLTARIHGLFLVSMVYSSYPWFIPAPFLSPFCHP